MDWYPLPVWDSVWASGGLMKTRMLKLAVGSLLISAFSPSLIHAQQRGAAPAGPPRLGFRVAPPTYQQNCGTCHGTQGSTVDGKKAQAIGELQEYSPERVYDFLNKATTAPHAGTF